MSADSNSPQTEVPALAVSLKLRRRVLELETVLGIPGEMSIAQILLEGFMEDFYFHGEFGLITGAYRFDRGPCWAEGQMEVLRQKWAAEDSAESGLIPQHPIETPETAI